jgi:hypothetical protein
MTVPTTLPAPRMNLTGAGRISRFTGVASTDIILAVGDFTGGASEDLFTLTSHGLVDGDILYVVAQSAQGAATGGPGLRAVVNQLDANTFQLTTNGTTVIENTADGTVTFLKGNAIPQHVADEIRSLIIVALNDTTAGTVEDMLVPYSGVNDIATGDTLKLLAKSAAGVHPSAVDTTVYVIAPIAAATAYYFQTSLTAGGASVDTTADGTAVFLKTS